MLAMWSLVPLPFLNPAWTPGSSQFTYCWSLAWRILSITLLACAAAAAKSLQSCLTLRPHRRQSTRLCRPWDSPGKNTGAGCHFLVQCMKVKSESEAPQSCPTLHNPINYSLPGSSVHGIFQARVLEWGAIAFSTRHHRDNKNFTSEIQKETRVSKRNWIYPKWRTRIITDNVSAVCHQTKKSLSKKGLPEWQMRNSILNNFNKYSVKRKKKMNRNFRWTLTSPDLCILVSFSISLPDCLYTLYLN